MNELLLSFSRHPKSKKLILLVGLILVLPSITSGFFADDFGHYVLIDQPELIPQSKQGSLYHLYSFIDNDVVRRDLQVSQSLIPWWTSDKLSINFWRPVSEISHVIDHKLLQSVPWLMHVHSLVWYVLLLFVIATFYQRILVEKQLAVFALLFFVVDSTHGITVAWIANRNALLAALFTLLALMLHHKCRDEGNKWMLIGSCFFLVLGFLSAEISISIVAFFLAYALFLDKSGAKKGILYLVPALLVVIVWQIFYRYLGYGISGNEAFYIDPVAHPIIFLEALFTRLPIALSAQFNILPFHLIEALYIPAVVSGVLIGFLLVVIGVRKNDSHYNFFLFSLCLSILPVATTIIQDRNLIFIGIAGAGVLAKLLTWLFEWARFQKYRSVALGLSAVVIVFHIMLSAIIMLPMSLAPKLIAKSSIDTALSLPDKIENKQIVSFGVPLFDVSYLSAIRKVNNLPIANKLWNITTFKQSVSVKRISKSRLLVSHPRELLQKEDFYLRNFSTDPMTVDMIFKFDGLTIQVVDVNESGVPRQLELRFDKDIDDETIQLMYWDDGLMQSFSLSNNETRQLPLSTSKNLFLRIINET